MEDFLKKLREQAEALARERAANKAGETPDGRLARREAEIAGEVAAFLGATPGEVESCCGSICPHCEMFLDKAIALVELGYPPHLFMNPVQEEMFNEALAIYRNDPKEYQVRKKELMDRMR